MAITISGSGSFTGATNEYTFDQSVGVAGTLTYEDVTDVDAVGVITAAQGLNVGPKTGIACTISAAGAITSSGTLYIASQAQIGRLTKPDVGLIVNNNKDNSSNNATIIVKNFNASGRLWTGTSSANATTSEIYGNGNAIFQGNVGIGTDNPAVISGMSKYLTLSAKAADNAVGLELEGNRTGSNQTVGRISFVNNGNEVVRINADSAAGGSTGNLTFTTSGTERVRITSAGRVGIGTDQPDQTLEVNSGPTANGVSLDTTYTGGPNISFKINGTIKSYIGSPTGFGAGDGDDLGLRATDNVIIHAGGGTERMRIDSSGRLLIGTVSSPTPSSVVIQGNSSGSSSYGLLRLTKGSTTPSDGDALGLLAFGDSNQNTNAQIASKRDGGTWTSGSSMPTRLEFNTTADGASGSTEHMRITGIGTVVIGSIADTITTMEPCRIAMGYGYGGRGNYLELGGTNRTANGINKVWVFRHGYWGGNEEVASMAVDTSSSPGGAGHGYGDLVINLGESGNGDGGSTSAERLRMNYLGTVFTVPTYNNTTSNAANVSIPNSDGQVYRSTSSIKYKDNVTTLTDALADKILECRPVSYTSKCPNDNNTKINYGLIAEEVNAIDPSLVFLDEGEPEGVQYDRFVPHLINLVKRLEKRLTDAGL